MNGPDLDFGRAVAAKREKIDRAREQVTLAERNIALGAEALFLIDYDDVPAGRFHNLDGIRLRWEEPDLFAFVPRATKPFAFERASGEVIEPRSMITDGGTIPRLAGLFRDRLSRWGFLPAYLIHDWEFELHHCGRLAPERTFEAVRDTMMEAVKTLMESNPKWKSKIDFLALFVGINSSIARRYWDPPERVCSLPSDRLE